MTHYSSYDKEQIRPVVGSTWVWGLWKAPEIIRVTKVRWNGEEWWVEAEAIPPATSHMGLLTLPKGELFAKTRRYWNDLTHFWENAHHVRLQTGPPGVRGACRTGVPIESEDADVHSTS